MVHIASVFPILCSNAQRFTISLFTITHSFASIPSSGLIRLSFEAIVDFIDVVVLICCLCSLLGCQDVV